MFDLDSTAVNKLTLNDGRSGSQIELHYRTPTTQEEVDYQAKAYRRKGKKMIVNAGMKVEKALAILTGFREGDFGLNGKPISSDPESSNYRQDWKEQLRKSATGILLAFAGVVFEGIRAENDMAADLEYEAITGDDTDVPL